MRVLLGRSTGADKPYSPKGPAASPHHRYRMEENRGRESRTSSQKGKNSVGITSQEGEPGGKKSSSIGKGNKKEELHRNTHEEEDHTGEGPDSKESNSGSKGECSEGCTAGGSPTKLTGCRTPKAGRQGGQRGSEGRSDIYHGQGETGPGNPRESEKFQQRGCQRNLDQGQSKEGPEPTPMMAPFEAGEQPDGSTNSKRSPHWGPISDQGLDAHADGSEAVVRAQSGSPLKPKGGDSGALRGHFTEAARLARIEVTSTHPQHRHQREEAKRSDLITSSQKGGGVGGPPTSGGGGGRRRPPAKDPGPRVQRQRNRRCRTREPM